MFGSDHGPWEPSHFQVILLIMLSPLTQYMLLKCKRRVIQLTQKKNKKKNHVRSLKIHGSKSVEKVVTQYMTRRCYYTNNSHL